MKEKDSIIIAGAGGFAKQLIDSIRLLHPSISLTCFDNFNEEKDLFLNTYPIVNTLEDIDPNSHHFVLGTGNPRLRKDFYDFFIESGFRPLTVLDLNSRISDFGVQIMEASNVLANVIIEPDVYIGIGSLINLNCIITHDVCIGEFSEISPGCLILGGAKIGDHCFIGAGSIVLPNVVIEDQCIIGAGTLVNKDLPKRTKVVGIPARKI